MGAKNIGIYSYSYSIVFYFGLFILLGLNNYGNRTIAQVRGNKKEMSKNFISIYFMQLLSGLFVLVLYLIYCIYISSDKLMSLIQIFYLCSCMINISWFYFGLEQFKLTVARDTIIKLLNILCIFIFVKNKDDLYLYALIMSVGPLISQFILWINIRRYIYFVRITVKDVCSHFRENLILFVPVIAVSLYTTMDKIILGLLSSMREVGFYENAYKLTNIPTMIVTSLGTVMLPRMSNLAAKGKKELMDSYIEKSLLVSAFLSVSMSLGICSVSSEFVPIFYGPGFDECIHLIRILVLSSIFSSWGNVIRTQYLVPNKKDSIFIISVFVGAIVNTILDFILIPQFNAIGGAVATLITEFSVCAYQTIKVRKYLSIKKYVLQCAPFFFFGLVMIFAIQFIPFISNSYLYIGTKVFVGAIVYVSLSLIYYVYVLKNI